MTKSLIIPNGILTINESKAICPYCERKIPFEEIENKFWKSKNHYIRFKDKCKRFIGITQDIKGDFRAFELQNSKHK